MHGKAVINKVVDITGEDARIVVYGVGVMEDNHVMGFQEQFTLQEERDTREDTRKRGVFWSFRNIKTRLSLIWKGEDDSWKLAFVFLEAQQAMVYGEGV